MRSSFASFARRIARRWDAVSLRTKITGVTVLLLTAGLVVAGLGTMSVLRGYLLEQVDRQLEGGIAEIGLASGFNLAEAESYFEDESSPLNPFYLAVVNERGQLLADNLPSHQEIRPDWEAIDFGAAAGTQVVTARSDDRTTQWRLLLTPVVVRESGRAATLVIGADLDDANETVARFGTVFLFFSLTVVILGGALTRLLATTTFAPLRRLEEQAARFADGDYGQRLTSAPPNTEVGRLTRSLNTMLARIDSAFEDRAKTIEQMRRFVGDASHELRTPLVTVRGYAELYRMGALRSPEEVGQAMERIEKEAVRMAGLVEDLLVLARLDAAAPGAAVTQADAAGGGRLQLADVDLLPLARDAAKDAMAAAPDRTVSVVHLDAETLGGPLQAARPADAEDTETKPILPPVAAAPVQRTPTQATGPIALTAAALARLVPRRTRPPVAEPEPALPEPPPWLDAVVRGDENKIRQVIANLVGNALRFSPAGSPLEIGVGVDAAAGRGVVAVIDHGDGVPPQIRDKIFQRFWRADTSRARETGGNGLGLAIVAAIVQAHGGSVDVVETPGGGASFRVWLPLSERAAAPAPPRHAS